MAVFNSCNESMGQFIYKDKLLHMSVSQNTDTIFFFARTKSHL